MWNETCAISRSNEGGLMRADDFYQTNIENAVPLTFKSQTDSLNECNAYERNCLERFTGALGDVVVISNQDGRPCNVYIGTGEGNIFQAMLIAVNRIPEGLYLAPKALEKTALIGWSLAQYRFDQYKTSVTPKRILAVDSETFLSISLEAEAIFLVRDLINRPANDLNPSGMADVLRSIATQHSAVFKEWIGEELLVNNFPAVHAVGRAASDAPRLLSLTWGNEAHPKVTLVGKGVCFDSGGLDIKPAAGMRLMKKDMGGAAQVIGLAQWMMAYKLPIRLQVLIPAVENAVGSQAFRPGDVLTMRNGLTVEIDNTDAEGRLVLADALVKACEDTPDLLIDFATLTGAARIAVGTEISAMFTNDDQLADSLMRTGQATNDPVWRMPLYEGYANMLDSSIADMANSSASSYAGAITAALFLQRFVQKNITWVHFDIMAWNVGNKPGRPEGGEAMGMLAMGQYLIDRFNR